MAVSKSRIFLWDNIKAFLILLVVVGHFADQYTEKSNMMNGLFLFIYTFHMPVFVFVSGLFSKSAIKNGRLQVNKVISYLILFYALKIFLHVIRMPFGIIKEFSFFSEASVPWYMFAMAAWICLIFLLRKVKLPILLPISIAASLAMGYLPYEQDVLCFSRVVIFFPLFLVGYHLNIEKLTEVTRSPILKIISAIILLSFAAICFIWNEPLYELRPLLTARNEYAYLPIPELGPLYRLGHYALILLLGFAVICLFPNRKTFFSYIGASTLAIYFIHRPIICVLRDCGFSDWLSDSFGLIGICIFLLMGVALTFLLSIKPINIPFNNLMRQKYGLSKHL